MFSNCGVIHIDKKKIKEEEIFEIAINAGAKDCVDLNGIFEVITEKEDFYKIKTKLEKEIETFDYSSIEWRPLNYINLDKVQGEQILELLTSLEELDDVQNIFTNANLKNLQI
jgi:transcriptional/translational regulatory protein YebC/TACO1